ncbi:hypothetical protein BXZ70DRAFT_690995 [Cristinia sonorae]|uniref:Peptidase metallopeptidase domain-containing protein n=1 Tax=Cristinia sonorae TaxID=1940300 RepID=A0A8K0XK50_9AGAR|nr:hypothetical protein BXZ70DRAFT_690995 [Cristinia sonorae]
MVPSEKAEEWSKLDPSVVRSRLVMLYAAWMLNSTPPKPSEPTPFEWFERTCADLYNPPEARHIADEFRLFAVMTKSSLLWDNGTELTYSFIDGSDVQHAKVEKTIVEWTWYTNITFKKVDANGQIRITFNPKLGSWSYVGKQIEDVAADKATMNLGVVKSTSGTTEEESGTILHEFGHTLGMLHEHQSPVRGGTITLKESAVYDFYTSTQQWPKDRVKSQIIDVYNLKDVSNFSKFDKESIMMYWMPRDMNEQDIEVKPNYVLSDTDRAFMVIHYPRPSPSSEAPTWTLAKALKHLGVDSTTAKKIVADQADADKVRARFTQWNAVGGNTEKTGDREKPTGPDHSISAPPPPAIDKRDWCASAQITEPKNPKLSDNRVALYAATVTGDSLWQPGETIKYWYQQTLYRTPVTDGIFEPRIRRVELLESVFAEYEATAHINFVEAKSEAEADVRICFRETGSNHERSWSRIGKDCRDPSRKNDPAAWGGDERTSLYLNLPRIDLREPNKTDLEASVMRTCRHQVGHILGLTHEHPSSDSGAEEFASIMLYPHSSGNPGDKLDDKEVLRTEKNVNLSSTDKALLQVIYPSSREKLQVALATLDVSDLDSRKLLDASAVVLSKKDQGTPGHSLAVSKFRASLSAQLYEKSTSSSSDPLFSLSDPLFAPEAPPGSEAKTGNFLAQMITELQKFFNPGGGQIFTLQFPGRFLQVSEYAWNTKNAGVYGQFVKPIAANESEFRLTDQLYDVAEVVSGPNGISLSQVYEQTLNNLIPAFRTNKLAKHQQHMRDWLLKDVKASDWVEQLMKAQLEAHDPAKRKQKKLTIAASSASGPAPSFALSQKLDQTTKTVSRMELSNALMQEYLDAKNLWEEERDDMMMEALKIKPGSEESEMALNELTRRLAHTTASRQAQLAAKYNDAVVRGYFHNVREYVGYLDVKSPSELLQDAKDAMRESSMSSLDGSLRVYPVQMSPIDWYEGLSTSFTMEDLTSDPTLIEAQIQAKSKQLDTLTAQMTSLLFGTKGKVEELQQKTSAAQATLDNAQSNLTSQYTHQVLSMARTCFNSSGKLNVAQLKPAMEKANLANEVITQLQKDLEDVATKQQALTNASRAYNDALASLRLAEATDTRQQQELIQQKIESTKREISELTTRYTSLNKSVERPAPDKTLKSLKDIDLFPPSNDTSGGSRWQQIQMHHLVESDYTRQTSSASSSSSSAQCNLWLASYSRSKSESQASSSNLNSKRTDEIELGFRATLVTVDRAGWFRPQFYKQSEAFYHIDKNITWSKWPDGVNNAGELKAKGEVEFQKLNKANLLPAYPVAYVICKDITIKIKNSSTTVSTDQSSMKKDAASSGGVLCFSFSEGSSSSQSENSHSVVTCTDGCVIRIPGPQVLGYIMQLTDPDLTDDIPDEIPEDFFVPEADYNKTHGGSSGPLHNIPAPPKPNPTLVEQIQNLLKQAHVPSDTLASVQEALQKELNSVAKK